MIEYEYGHYKKLFPDQIPDHKSLLTDYGLYEYYGQPNAKTVLVAMGSVIGTMKDALDEIASKKLGLFDSIGVLKVKTFRPFPHEQIRKVLAKTKYVAVIDKSISLGQSGPLALELQALLRGERKRVNSYIVGLGGRDITKSVIARIAKDIKAHDRGLPFFMGKLD